MVQKGMVYGRIAKGDRHSSIQVREGTMYIGRRKLRVKGVSVGDRSVGS